MVVVNQFKDPQDPRNEGVPNGLPGLYRAVLTLQRPGRPLTGEYAASFEGGLRGDSHLAIAKPAYSPPIDATQIRGAVLVDNVLYQWDGFPNERGLLGKIVLQPFQALTLRDAEQKAYRAVASSLSNWAAHLDIPLQVSQIDVTELRTGNTQVSFINPWQERPAVGASEAEMSIEYRSAVSIYREALESTSLVYRFLCFFKVIEAVRSLRVRRQREAARSGIVFSRPPEVVPTDEAEFEPWLNGIYAPRPAKWDPLTLASVFIPQARGKSFEELVGPGKGRKGAAGPLRRLRDDVVHGLWQPAGPVTMFADELLHHTPVHMWLPLTRCIARYMLKHEFPEVFLSSITAPTTPDK